MHRARIELTLARPLTELLVFCFCRLIVFCISSQLLPAISPARPPPPSLFSLCFSLFLPFFFSLSLSFRLQRLAYFKIYQFIVYTWGAQQRLSSVALFSIVCISPHCTILHNAPPSAVVSSRPHCLVSLRTQGTYTLQLGCTVLSSICIVVGHKSLGGFVFSNRLIDFAWLENSNFDFSNFSLSKEQLER